jgi:predicted nucleotidyltransferase
MVVWLTMPVTPDDVVRRLRAEARLRGEETRARAAALRTKLGAAASILRKAGASRVWLFGSMVDPAATTIGDVDLACDGLDTRRYFDALAELMELFRTKVDLVLLERSPASLRDRVVETGEELP